MNKDSLGIPGAAQGIFKSFTHKNSASLNFVQDFVQFVSYPWRIRLISGANAKKACGKSASLSQDKTMKMAYNCCKKA
jgi:hypothetical protein